MFSFADDPFLPASAQTLAAQALHRLEATHCAADAVEVAIEVEDLTKNLLASGELSPVQGMRLYQIFEAALEIHLRGFGATDSTPRQFP